MPGHVPGMHEDAIALGLEQALVVEVARRQSEGGFGVLFGPAFDRGLQLDGFDGLHDRYSSQVAARRPASGANLGERKSAELMRSDELPAQKINALPRHFQLRQKMSLPIKLPSWGSLCSGRQRGLESPAASR
ncbi:hypothetical protein FQZ97_943820 [compost metagenome]